MKTRRQVQRSRQTAEAIASIPIRVISAEEEAAYHAAALSQAMGKCFGGSWKVKFDELGEFVVVSKAATIHSSP